VSLRRRLVALQAGLVALGLALFAVVSYRLYSDYAYQRVDSQLQSASPLLSRSLGPGSFNPGSGSPGSSGTASSGTRSSGPGEGQGPGSGATGYPDGGQVSPPVGAPPAGAAHNLPAGSYAELRSATGGVVDPYQVPCYQSATCPVPKLPKSLPPVTSSRGRIFTVAATDGSTTFRVLARPVGDDPDLARAVGTAGTVITAVPLTDLSRSLHNLLLLDLSVGAGVLVLLSAAGLVVVRRGLHPLERMAGAARAIAKGDLSQRASPADGRSEVGQLGLAFNTMMGEIEHAFAARDGVEARLRQFLADASHELRTPLTSIRGYSELYRIGAVRSTDELATVMARIEQSAQQMGGLVEELLLLAQLDQTRPPERTPVDLVVLVADACNNVAVAAPAHPLRLHAGDPVSVLGDPGHLRQAVTNLLDNAVRHTPDGTSIDVTVGSDGGAALVRVRDHGSGLTEDGLVHAFDRFWRAERSRTGTGSGLGLAIVAGVATEHGGHVTAANAADGGALFDLRLPIPSDQSPLPVQSDQSPRPPAPQPVPAPGNPERTISG
jgi:two-component system OmpR family sensor kinase